MNGYEQTNSGIYNWSIKHIDKNSLIQHIIKHGIEYGVNFDIQHVKSGIQYGAKSGIQHGVPSGIQHGKQIHNDENPCTY